MTIHRRGGSATGKVKFQNSSILKLNLWEINYWIFEMDAKHQTVCDYYLLTHFVYNNSNKFILLLLRRSDKLNTGTIQQRAAAKGQRSSSQAATPRSSIVIY